ncbi:putative Ig domain-containing protein [Phenylobacterium sp.]|uniref:putative Ig domain-containing protein n=1 Tax=Phenylobacterium sp. TaxID=1871053 RepID=UPI00356721F5
MPWINQPDALGRMAGGWFGATISILAASGVPDPVTRGQAYSWQPFRSGGKAPFTWSVQTGTLPTGLSQDTSTGLISASNPTQAVGDVAVTLRVTDSAGIPVHIDIPVTFHVADPLTILGTPTSTLAVGDAYTFTPTASGGRSTKVFALTGSLPAGWTFSTSTGGIAGTAATEATVSGLNISVTDADGRAASLGTFSITITAAAGGGGGTALLFGDPLPQAAVGYDYLFKPNVVSPGGGSGSWSITAGTLPAGLTCHATNGIQGTCTTAENKTGIVMTWTDSNGATDFPAFPIRVLTPTVLTGGAGLWDAIHAATAPAYIVCDGSDWSAGGGGLDMFLNGIFVSDFVTVRAVSEATADYVFMDGSQGLIWKDWTTTSGKVGGSQGSFGMDSCDRIWIDGGQLTGTSGLGILVNASTNVKVTNNTIPGKGAGISSANSENVVVTNTHLSDISDNGAIFLGVQGSGGVLNRFMFNYNTRPATDDPDGHPDSYQWGASVGGGGRRSSDWVISYNNLDRDTGSGTQFIFIEHTDNVSVIGNACFGTYTNAISIADGDVPVIQDNWVQGFDFSAVINLRDGCISGVVNNNVANVIDIITTGDNIGCTASGNTHLDDATGSSDRSAYTAAVAARPWLPTA